MKNKSLLSGVLLLLVAVCLFSCNSAKKQIARKWNLTDMANPKMDRVKAQLSLELKSLDDSIKANTDTDKINRFKSRQSMNEMMMKNIEAQKADSKGKTVVDFMNDGNYTANLYGEDQKGKWELDASGKKLIIQMNGEPTRDTMNISTLTADNLSLTQDSVVLTFSAAK